MTTYLLWLCTLAEPAAEAFREFHAPQNVELTL